MVGSGDNDVVPDRCDGCGRKAASCGMVDHGWMVRTMLAGFAGAYCPDCATALHWLPWTIRCSECGLQKANEAAAERAGFLFFPDGLGGLLPLCGTCAATRLGKTAPAMGSENR
jgi:hypothetical protein